MAIDAMKLNHPNAESISQASGSTHFWKLPNLVLVSNDIETIGYTYSILDGFVTFQKYRTVHCVSTNLTER